MARVSSEDGASSSSSLSFSPLTPTLIISTMICKVFAPVGVCQAWALRPTWTPHLAGPQAAAY